MLQEIPTPIYLSHSKVLYRIQGRDYTFPAPQQEPERWVYVPEKARRIVHFMNRHIRHIKGDMIEQSYELMPWIMAYTCELFGWVDKETGLRRYFESYAEVGRKNSKTLTNAGLGLASILVLSEHGGAESYCLASTQRQAEIAYEMASTQIKLCEREGDPGVLNEYLEYKDSLLRIKCKQNSSFFEALSGSVDGKVGTNPSFVIVDEIHEIKNQKLLTAIRTGMVGRGESLFNMITTAGDDKTTAGYKEHLYAQKLLAGTALNDRYMPLIFAACENDDPHSPETWEKANPGLGISVKLDQLKAIHDKAWSFHTGSAGEIAQGGGDDAVTWEEFLRYHLNIWTTKSAGYVSLLAWQDCKDEAILKTYEGRLAFSGLDLAESIDMNALVLAFPTWRSEEEEIEEGVVEIIMRLSLDVIPWYWVCESAAKASESTSFNYRNAIAHNLEITDGDTADYDLIERRIVSILKRVKHQEEGFDPYNAAGIAQRLQDRHKIKMTKVRQGFLTLNEPTKQFRDLILRRELRHPGNPIYDWNIRNCQVVKDTSQNIKLSKEHSGGKIDGAAATINALRCILDAPQPKQSVYSTRGIRRL